MGVLVSTSHGVEAERVRFEVRSHPDAVRPFVVLDLGTPFVSLHVFEPQDLAALAAVVAEAHQSLTAAVTGQDVLPVDAEAVPA